MTVVYDGFVGDFEPRGSVAPEARDLGLEVAVRGSMLGTLPLI
jgi:hypothetical protein